MNLKGVSFFDIILFNIEFHNIFVSLSFRFRIMVFTAICILLPAAIFLGVYVPQKIDDDSTLAWTKLEQDSNRLADLMEMKLTDYKYIFQTISPYEQIDEIVEWRKNNVTLQEYYDSLNSTEKMQGDIYPPQIHNTSLYQTTYHYFNRIQHTTEGIDFIGIQEIMVIDNIPAGKN